MFKVQRISNEPATALRVQISLPVEGEAGLAHGGTFWFQPADDPSGDTWATLNEQQARAIMDDPGLAVHFTCTPPLPTPAVEAQAPAVDQPADDAPADDVARDDGGGASKKKKGKA